ncbi:nitrilase [bacterium]|nr:nitrilase [bacterium]
MTHRGRVRVAVAQPTPVMLNPEATAVRAVERIKEAAQAGAKLVLLPEAFVPGYPRGLGFGTVVGARSPDGRDEFRELWDVAVTVPGPVTRAIAAAARDATIHVGVGVVERCQGTLYCTLLLFDDRGELILHHRKLRPTGAERLMWGEGDGSSLTVVETPFGRVGGLICWENYMPLARAALYAQGIEIYLAPTADARETWQATLRHIACEGRCFVLGCNQFVRRSDYPAHWAGKPEIAALPEIACRGGSAIYGPLGDPLAGPVWDREELIVADIDLDDIARGKFDFDATGHYGRPDVFELRVNRSRQRSVVFREVAEDGTDLS